MSESDSRIVHLGLGNFHRAHQAVYTRDAGDGWSITGVAHRNRAVVDALAAQSNRYYLAVVDDADTQLEAVDVITDGLVLADDPAAVAVRIADPNTAVVTLTITEAGYRVPAVDDGDGAGSVSASALGVLADGLQRRMVHGVPITLISCDNLSGNGAVLRDALTTIADGDSALLDYLDARVACPATMVDRIVPATTPAIVELVAGFGVRDAVPVPAEPFSQWVIEPRFAGPHPAWDQAGAIFSDDVSAWETVKVRLLNGSHSLIAYLGLLQGEALVADAFATPAVRRAVDALGATYEPTLQTPDGLDVAEYRRTLATRFGNRALGHRCRQIAMDGSLKLAQRVPEAALWWLDRGTAPQSLALLVAAYLQVVARGGAASEPPPDPAAAALTEAAARHTGGRALAAAALTNQALLGDQLGSHDEFVGQVGDLLDVLERHGAEAAVRAAT